MKKDNLGDRMKGYETVAKQTLMPRTPVIIRLDGKAFHTWTRQLRNMVDQASELERDPFSSMMNNAMAGTTELLVQNIQNAVLGYTQSDEISILLNDWKTLDTDRWFGNSMQKMASVSASMATAYFNEAFADHPVSSAMFDARVFNVPKEEVANYFIWRQQDATRNSINMLGQHYFSHKEMHKKNVSQVQDMLMLGHGVNWNDIDTWKKRGTCVTRNARYRMIGDDGIPGYAPGSSVEIDWEIPIFTADRQYVEQFLDVLKD